MRKIPAYRHMARIAALSLAALLVTSCASDKSTSENTASGPDVSGDSVKVGVLHSLSGTMAISEEIDTPKASSTGVDEEKPSLGRPRSTVR